MRIFGINTSVLQLYEKFIKNKDFSQRLILNLILNLNLNLNLNSTIPSRIEIQNEPQYRHRFEFDQT